MIPEDNRLYVWMIVKNLDHPRHKMVALLDKLEIEIFDRDSGYPYIRRSDLLELLYEITLD